MKVLSITLAFSCLLMSGCASGKPPAGSVHVIETDDHGKRKAYDTPAPSAPAPQCPCVTLTSPELNVLGPIVGDRFRLLQQETNDLGAVIQDIQRQAAPKPEPAPKK